MPQERYYLWNEVIVKSKNREFSNNLHCKKFHRFLYGREFTLQTIFGLKKGIPNHTANRLQHYGIILLNYNFRMDYVPSKKLGHADELLRLISK